VIFKLHLVQQGLSRQKLTENSVVNSICWTDSSEDCREPHFDARITFWVTLTTMILTVHIANILQKEITEL